VGTRDKFGADYRKIVRRLVEQRIAVGMTQSDLADAIGTDQSQISKFERGERRIDIIDYARICRAIGLDPAAPLRSLKLGK
jgi:transcriptional regulator with XRE-family HTH domain